MSGLVLVSLVKKGLFYLKLTYMRFPQILFLTLLLSGFSAPLFSQYAETGYAVYYADYLAGRKTAYGEIYAPQNFTCAHKKHPLGTLLKVTRINDGRSIVVRVNDKGPFNDGYIVDLSKVAGQYIGLDLDGKAQVTVEVVGYSNTNPIPEGYIPPRALTNKGVSPATYGEQPSSYNVLGANSGDAGEIKRLVEGQGGFGIQVASYSLEENATQQAKALQEQGIQDLFIQESWTSYKGKMFRLIIGQYQNRDQAVKQLDYLRRQKGVNGFVTMLK